MGTVTTVHQRNWQLNRRGQNPKSLKGRVKVVSKERSFRLECECKWGRGKADGSNGGVRALVFLLSSSSAPSLQASIRSARARSKKGVVPSLRFRRRASA